MSIPQVQPYSNKNFPEVSPNSSFHSLVRSPGYQSTHLDHSLVRSLVRLLFKQAYLTHATSPMLRSSLDSTLDLTWLDRVESGMAGYFQDNEWGYFEQSLRMAHHLSWLTWTGYYSIHFNRIIDRPETFPRLPLMTSAECFPEVYANPEISSADRELIEGRIHRERTALKEAFTLALTQVKSGQVGLFQIKFFRSNDDRSLNQPDELSEDLYSQSYRQIILREHLPGTLFELTRSTYSPPVQRQLIFGSNGHDQIELYTLDMHELLMALHQGQINPRTHLPIDPVSVNLIQINYWLELKLLHPHSS